MLHTLKSIVGLEKIMGLRPKPTKVLFTGGRKFNDGGIVVGALSHILPHLDSNVAFCTGGADGLDKLAEQYVKSIGHPCFVCDANWTQHNLGAGTKRNGWMLKYFEPEVLIKFPGGSGTRDMVTQVEGHNKKVPLNKQVIILEVLCETIP